MALIMTDVQSAILHIAPADAKGNPALIEGVVWAVSDPALLSVVAAADGLSATIAAIGPLGTAQVNVQGDALIGDGIVALTGLLDVTVVASIATTLAITAEPPF